MRRSIRAITLIETIVALVLLSGVILLVSALMQRTTQYQRRSEDLLAAAALADQTLDEVRRWAQLPANYDGTWATWQGRELTHPTRPALRARVDVQRPGPTTLSPDHYTELALADRRVIHQAVVGVRVRAGTDLSSPLTRVDVWTYVASPSPRMPGARVQVNSLGSGLMNPGESRNFQAEAFDGQGRPLPQCCFEWKVRNMTGMAQGNATARDGRQFILYHNRTRWDEDLGVDVPAEGIVEVIAEARIMGRLIKGSSPVDLGPGP